ncbi:MAG: DNA repair protein RecN [Prevotella sp.]|nr:DNA repair protein RecN [Prevotella sp.]
MLKQLYIRNFTLIDTLDIELKPGFSVITGETGAGKSIILGAIGLLLGQRADAKNIKQGADKCIIEAHFDLSKYSLEVFFENNDIEYDAHDTIIRRELTSAGKSRAFINDTPVSLAILKELGEQLVDIHSQHQNLLLNKQDFQLNVVDIIANNNDLLSQYRTAYNKYQETKKKLENLILEIEQNRSNSDFLRFQYEELCNAKLYDGEQEELEQKQATMSHAEEIKSALYEADNSINAEIGGVLSNVKNAKNALKGIMDLYPVAQELQQRLDSCYIELDDISHEISTQLQDIDFDPAELEYINNRLDKIYELEKKYHCETINELLCKIEELKQQLDYVDNSDIVLNELKEQLDIHKKECETKASKLSQTRKKSALSIEKEISEKLVVLGMPNINFKVNIEKKELGLFGADNVSFMFSANKNNPLQAVTQVASGGEIARLMLSLKAMISGAVKLPTIIFDEIDTGVSGKIAEKMANIMKEMGDNDRQVISITHLPQIAALGTTHYKVYKEDTSEATISKMTILNEEERIKEIAQMLSGSDISDAAINNAKELLRL